MTAVGRFSTRPLYLQVKDMLIQRIAAGAWKPGAAIPNEIELSRELGISVNTVRNHVQHVLAKLGAHSQLEAVAIASRLGLLRSSRDGVISSS